jgi:hypothetical protein
MSEPLPARRRAAWAPLPAVGLTCGDVSGHNPPGHRAGIRILVPSTWVHKVLSVAMSLAMAEFGKPGAKSAQDELAAAPGAGHAAVPASEQQAERTAESGRVEAAEPGRRDETAEGGGTWHFRIAGAPARRS